MKKKIVLFAMILCTLEMLSLNIVIAKKKGISGSEIVTLEKCVDGDTATFKSSDGTTFKTRFLAIDTPETVHPTKEVEAYGKDASEYTCNSLTNAKEIKLEYDGSAGMEDKYGRRLAWIFVDGNLLQQKLIELGYAKVAYLYGDYEYTEILEETEEIAKANKTGLWNEENEEKTATSEESKIEKAKEAEKTMKTKPKKKKSWIEKLVDYTLGKIMEYIDNLLEKIVKWVEDML